MPPPLAADRHTGVGFQKCLQRSREGVPVGSTTIPPYFFDHSKGIPASTLNKDITGISVESDSPVGHRFLPHGGRWRWCHRQAARKTYPPQPKLPRSCCLIAATRASKGGSHDAPVFCHPDRRAPRHGEPL